jgi:hypothetical protein
VCVCVCACVYARTWQTAGAMPKIAGTDKLCQLFLGQRETPQPLKATIRLPEWPKAAGSSPCTRPTYCPVKVRDCLLVHHRPSARRPLLLRRHDAVRELLHPRATARHHLRRVGCTRQQGSPCARQQGTQARATAGRAGARVCGPAAATCPTPATA